MRLLLPATAAICLTMAAIISFARGEGPSRSDTARPGVAPVATTAG